MKILVEKNKDANLKFWQIRKFWQYRHFWHYFIPFLRVWDAFREEFDKSKKHK
jgi:hypothetical protein